MFIEALVTVASLQNWPKCPLSDERQGEYSVYAQWGVTKPQRKEMLSFAAKEKKRDIILNENSQIQKGKD